MPDPIIQVQTFQQKVAHQAEIAFKSGSTYVVAVFGALLLTYVALDEGSQKLLLAQFPILKGWTPVITFLATFFLTKLRPSGAVSTQTQSMVDELVRLRMNEYLRSKGAPELPVPTPTPLPIAPTLPVPPSPAPAPPPVDPMYERFAAAATRREPVDIPVEPPPSPAPTVDPTDERLLLSLFQEYIKQQQARARAGAPLGSGIGFEQSRR